jgi:muconolactone delta-isomerase
MRFLVIGYGKDNLDFGVSGEAAVASHKLRDELMAQGKIIEHAHIAGFRAHMWIYDVESVDELDRVVSGDPMSIFSKGDPLILALTSYERMEERERLLIGTPAEQQTKQSEIVNKQPQTKPGESRYLVIAYGKENVSMDAVGDAPARANRYREDLIRQGKISMHAHIAGQRGHVWIYHVTSADELDRVISTDPMAGFSQGDPMILPLCSYERMHEREEQFFSHITGKH